MGLTIVLPYSLTAGQTAKAAEVMGNLNKIVNELAGSAFEAVTFEPGDLKATALPAAPTGWLLCDGSAISRITYAELFAAISTTYGAGNGTSTFNIPDLRARVPIGVDGEAGRLASEDALGKSGGASTHTLSTAEIPAHSHAASLTTLPTTGGSSAIAASSGGGLPPTERAVGVSNAGGGGAHNNMQPYQVVNWMIKI